MPRRADVQWNLMTREDVGSMSDVVPTPVTTRSETLVKVEVCFEVVLIAFDPNRMMVDFDNFDWHSVSPVSTHYTEEQICGSVADGKSKAKTYKTQPLDGCQREGD